jgi:hypothetical protein
MIELTRDLLAGGDHTTLVSQPAHQLIEYQVLSLLIKGGKNIHVTVHRNRFIFNNQPDALIIQIYSVMEG